jgi:hypothetical protein
MLEISCESVQNILNDNLNMSRIATIFMSHLLDAKQKENHVNAGHDLQDRLQTDPEFLLKITTGIEMWVYR